MSLVYSYQGLIAYLKTWKTINLRLKKFIERILFCAQKQDFSVWFVKIEKNYLAKLGKYIIFSHSEDSFLEKLVEWIRLKI
jgi:hypothetical protein